MNILILFVIYDLRAESCIEELGLFWEAWMYILHSCGLRNVIFLDPVSASASRVDLTVSFSPSRGW